MNKTQYHEISEPITSIHYENLRQFGKAHQLDIRGLVKLRQNLHVHIELYTRLLLRSLQQRHGIINPHMIQHIDTFNDTLKILNTIYENKHQWEEEIKTLSAKKDSLKIQTYLFEKLIETKSKPDHGTSLVTLFKESLDWQYIDRGCLLELYKNDYCIKHDIWGRVTNNTLTDVWKRYLNKSFMHLKTQLPELSYMILEDIIMDLFEIEVETYAAYFNIEAQKICNLKNKYEKEYKETIERIKTSPKYTDRYSSYTPSNEQGVVLLFGRLHELLGFEEILHVQTIYPDCVAIRDGNEVCIEFEFKSSGFLDHIKNKQVQDGDICVCWENDHNLPVETIELKSFLFQ